MKFTIEPMSLGDILSRATSLFFSRIMLFMAIEVIVAGPTLILQLALPEVAMGSGALLFILPMIVLGPLGAAAMVHVIAQEYMGQPVSLSGAFKFALGRLLPLIGTSILANLQIGLGMIFCLIPGIYLAVIWAFVNQVVVMENETGAAALTRSKNLVSGYFWHVFVVLLVVGLVLLLPSTVINIVLPEVLPFQEPLNPMNPFAGFRMTSYVNFAIVEVVATVMNGIFQAFTAICATLLYFDLRNRKEAFDVGHIVAWMDQYRDWRDEPVTGIPPAAGAAPPQTGIKDTSAAIPPPQTGIKDPSTPRPEDQPPPVQ